MLMRTKRVALFPSVLHNLAQISTIFARELVVLLLAAGSAVVTNSMIGYGKAASQQANNLDTQDYAQIEVPYNHDLKALEDVLKTVRRPGDFYVRGALETPLPRLTINGVGAISFPVPASQIRSILKRAEQAPYGRGEETILDTSVRNAWQIAPSEVRIEGRSWERTFQQILSTVTDGLGCTGMKVSAELYKLLIYGRGGFFLSHRDTEKTDGMFGTLTVVLPSVHAGGELVVRHGGREVTIDLSEPGENCELGFAAFYADCEHAIQPITKGSRICLIYNLLQGRTGKRNKAITPPVYDTEAERAGEILKQSLQKSGAPAKLAWLLEHEYSPAGLSFSGLKGRDAAIAKLLRQAASEADCALHLAIMHIEESGAAEPDYETYYVPTRGWRPYADYELDESDDSHYEVIEVCESSRYIDQWVDTNDHVADFGSLPVAEDEILPAGALEGEAPDQQRLTEATGNEGASFERSYHRAALVLWPRNRFVDVLLQAGPSASLPYFQDRLRAWDPRSPAADRQSLCSIAERIITAWERTESPTYGERAKEKESARSHMIRLLGQLGDERLLGRFLAGVVTREYDGSENQAIVTQIRSLETSNAGKLLSRLASENMRLLPAACVNLLSRLTRKRGLEARPDWIAALKEIGASMVGALQERKELNPEQLNRDRWWREPKPFDSSAVADLLDALAACGADTVRDAAVQAITEDAKLFNPDTVIVTVLELLHQRSCDAALKDKAFQRLGVHSARFLLSRSEQPPEPPRNWRQDVKITCKCGDCRELEAFVVDPDRQTHRFPVRKERRQHLHRQIDSHGLDMTHVTERLGSPQTLICRKTRAGFERQWRQYEQDLVSMRTLSSLMKHTDDEVRTLRARMDRARQLRAVALGLTEA